MQFVLPSETSVTDSFRKSVEKNNLSWWGIFLVLNDPEDTVDFGIPPEDFEGRHLQIRERLLDGRRVSVLCRHDLAADSWELVYAHAWRFSQ